jgi:CRISPR-associated protein Cas5d
LKQTKKENRMAKVYPISMEVAGPLAMFSRPDTGATPTSYPAPTWSACKGILESIAMLSGGQAWVHPSKVEVCKLRGSKGGSVHYQRYRINYGGPLRKDSLINKGNNMQLIATVLADVCYRIYAEIRSDVWDPAANRQHHLQDLIIRRLKQGRCHHTPALGWREFTCSYWGPFREDYVVDQDLHLTIPSMLVGVWDRPINGSYGPQFAQEARVAGGVLHYAQ